MNEEIRKRMGFRADYDEDNRVIKQENVEYQGKKLFVSTVDLGLDHSFGVGPKLYWETMVFEENSLEDIFMNRYPTKELAQKGHEDIVRKLRNNLIYINTDGYLVDKE